METIKLQLRDEDYDLIVKRGLPEAGDLTLALKLRATVAGRPAVAIGFTVHLPNGDPCPVQAVTPLAALSLAVRSIEAAVNAATS